jgi:hypothetical protein
MTINTTCGCNACANINSLGLKIVMHCGEFVKTEIGGRETLSGPDVIMVHRLLKNQVRETTGIDNYMLVTQRCVDDLGVAQIVAGWTEHTEEYEHVGAIKGYVSSLPDVWAFVSQQNENKVLQRDAWLTLSAHSYAPPAIVWDNLVDPVKRTQWMQANGNDIVGAVDGRIGPGAEYHCAHGDDNELLIFTVLDRRPVDYITFMIPMGDGIGMRYTDYVIPSGNGTRILSITAPLFSIDSGEDLPAETLAQMAGPVGDQYQASLGFLAEMSNAAAASLAAT